MMIMMTPFILSSPTSCIASETGTATGIDSTCNFRLYCCIFLFFTSFLILRALGRECGMAKGAPMSLR